MRRIKMDQFKIRIQRPESYLELISFRNFTLDKT